ncbi:ATP-binding protein [Streptomyces sp. NPDC006251]|uniref:ATP-binding protein n=1 Tax=Streptomyces sp. NPDC006251 TaxID=3155718 RepID=UPI00339F6C79
MGAMRRIAAAKLSDCGLNDLINDVMLIVSELWTNALVHSGATEITLDLDIRAGFLHVTVVDGMPGDALSKPADGDAESGRGLALVEALVEERGGTWGTSEGGTQTWCNLPVQAEERQ